MLFCFFLLSFSLFHDIRVSSIIWNDVNFPFNTFLIEKKDKQTSKQATVVAIAVATNKLTLFSYVLRFILLVLTVALYRTHRVCVSVSKTIFCAFILLQIFSRHFVPILLSFGENYNFCVFKVREYAYSFTYLLFIGVCVSFLFLFEDILWPHSNNNFINNNQLIQLHLKKISSDFFILKKKRSKFYSINASSQ